ncbi:MAG: efflux RND transporter periplasmic adaptor subunit [Kiritimatiellae bacterium]|nr:efflux RND transporter periplasmic adaptor subunit [Kiritimatiellia bacterium]
MKKLLFVLIILGGAGAGGWYWYKQQPSAVKVNRFRTETIAKGDVVQDVTATGTIAPIKEVEVGTQVNGPILHLYVDYNSVVTNGQVIAEIDPAVYKAASIKAKAQLKSNEASVENIQVKLDLAEKTLKRNRELRKKEMVAESVLDDSAAEVDSLKAQLKVAQATVEQSRANADEADTNLGYCTIRAPVNGVVISRDVDEGQTVVSSMSAQKLFTIAEDLKKIQVEASVPEADVGGIRVNQLVTFTVDAYRQTFTGRVKQIRLASTTTSNVVTYPVIIEAENPEEKLFPGMTANISIKVAEAKDATLIPAGALRFTPLGFVSEIKGRKIWILGEDGIPQDIKVRVGITDSTKYELKECDIDLVGKEAIVGMQAATAAASKETKNPFMPNMPRRNRRSGGGGPGGPR